MGKLLFFFCVFGICLFSNVFLLCIWNVAGVYNWNVVECIFGVCICSVFLNVGWLFVVLEWVLHINDRGRIPLPD